MAFHEAGLEAFTAPPHLRKIEAYAFFNCKKLKELNLNEELETLGHWCFSATGVAEARIPASVKIISAAMFRNCEKLE